MSHVPDAINLLIQHIEKTTFRDLPASTVAASKTFILDSIGVGLSGSRIPNVAKIKQAVSQWGEGHQAQVWVTGEWLPAVSAAAINGYQIHNQEWDCVHEPAVVHPMAVILSSLVAYAQQHNLSAKQLILGVVIAVDVATLIGECVTSSLKFFRPSICGCLGAAAGICAMQGIKGETLQNALGIAYSQLSGTMQSHVEGSPMLAMQIGINAAAAIRAVDMAEAGFTGPKDILQGPYGYFHLFEDSYDLSPLVEKLGREFQIEQVSHKPFPTGRAGHGTIDGLLRLQKEHGFSTHEIARIDIYGTPLIIKLVGRPVKQDMDASYAKLCNGYIAASLLLTGSVGVADFEQDCLDDPDRIALGAKVHTHVNEVQDLNALVPVRVSVTLNSGTEYQVDLKHVLGSPQNPLSRDAQIAKFTAACSSAVPPFNEHNIGLLIKRIDQLEQIPNINSLVEVLVSNR
ncbi:MmgE/PrpD family protein [Paraglaciecola sp. 20A4]|uniref:MmgE/PrpD family protein n=1 Tax=Paraglaciecola sp. 20A4 TaxID=2687288 RepID=UPI00140B7663|nr:MmgE/PrpD family protein [Paraglaciecola sp. 20A4]